MKQLLRPKPVGSTGTLPRTANTSRNSSRSTSPCSSSVSGSSGIPRSISSSNAGSRDRTGSSRLVAPSTPSSTLGRLDASAHPSKSKKPISVPGSPAVNSIPRRSHLAPKNTNSLTKKATISGLASPSIQPQNNIDDNDHRSDPRPPTTMMDKFKVFRETGNEKPSEKATAPVSKLGQIRPKCSGLTLSRKEVEAAVESSLGQKKKGSNSNSTSPSNSASPPLQSNDDGPPRPDYPVSGFGFPGSIVLENTAQQRRSSRTDNKSKPTHHISTPRHNARSASSHLRAPGTATESSQIPPPPKSALLAPTIQKPSINVAIKDQGNVTPRTSRRTGIPLVPGRVNEGTLSKYGSLSRRKISGNNSASHSRERSAASSNETLSLATTPDAPVPVPPPRGTSKLSSVANVPYPAGITGPQETEQEPHSMKTSSSSRSGRQKARALYNAVKQREDSRSSTKESSSLDESVAPNPPSDKNINKEAEVNLTVETTSLEKNEAEIINNDPLVLKPMAPLNCSVPNSYLQFLGTRRNNTATPKHLAISRVIDNDTSESGTPLSDGSQTLDVSGYMSDCGVTSDNGGHRWGGNNYQSDNSGYLSEGGYVSDTPAVNVYAGRIQRRFKEGLRAVEESLQSTQDISNSDVDLGLQDDDVSSISSGNLSDIAAELANSENTSSRVRRGGGEPRDPTIGGLGGGRRLGGWSRACPPAVGGGGGIYAAHRQMYQHRGPAGQIGSLGGVVRTGGGAACYSSDVEESSPYARYNHNSASSCTSLQQQQRKYASSDVESDCYNSAADFDISSSYSLDLLSGRLGSDYYFSDTESIMSRPPLPRSSASASAIGGGGRKSDAGLHTDQSTVQYLRKMSSAAEAGPPTGHYGSGGVIVSANCPMHNARQHQHPIGGIGGGMRRPSPDGLSAYQRQALSRGGHAGSNSPAGGHSTSQSPSASRLGLIRSGAGQSSAMDDLDSSLSDRQAPCGDVPVSGGGFGGGGGGGSGVLLSNVKLPYAIGVKNSYSNSSLSRNDLTDDMDVKGSHLSLVSIGSCRSVNDERQTQEIRKLRIDLELAQQKVTTLSSQLTTNAHVVSAFDHNLASMTSRLQALNATTEKKENEIHELKAALENLKRQNAAMNGGLSGSPSSSAVGASESGDNLDGSLRSAESLTSLNSTGSGGQDGSSKRASKESKDKKTGWLRQSFGKAFKKKSKGGGTEMDSECYQQAVNSVMATYGATAAEAEDLLALKRELEEKDLRLTDVQLESLASTQQLEQLRDMMEKMKSEMTTLKTDNERLQRLVRVGGEEVGVGGGGVREVHPGQGVTGGKMAAGHEGAGGEASPETSDLKKKLSLDVGGSLSLGFDLLFGFPLEEESGKRVPVTVQLPQELRQDPRRRSISSSLDGGGGSHETRSVHLGLVSVSSQTKWEGLDASVRRLFREYVGKVDPLANLGLNGDSIQTYSLTDAVVRSKEYLNTPDLLPFGYLAGLAPEEMRLLVTLKGTVGVGGGGVGATGANTTPGGGQSYLDTLAFDTLIPKTVLQRYICLLLEHQRIMLCGPSGTGKTFLANRLADYLVTRANRRQHEGAIATFNVDHKSSKELRTYLSNLAEQIDSNRVPPDQLPTVIILDNLHHVTSLAEVFNSFLSVKHQRSPFIIGTMNQSTTTTTNLQLHHNFRWVLCTNHMEPVKGFLGRYLRRKLVQWEVTASEHHLKMQCIVEWLPLVWQHLNRFLENFSSADVTIGPRLFLSCPMDTEASKVWFTDLWNYSLVPYLLEAVREGLQLYGRRGP